MDGLWTLKCIDVKTKKTIKKSNAYFKNGYLSGAFLYYDIENNLPFFNYSELLLTGHFNTNGNFDSTWVISYTENNISFEDIRKFKDGCLYYHIIKDLSTGEIINKYKDATVIYTPNENYPLEGSPGYIESDIYSEIFDLWKRVKTPNTIEFENPYERPFQEKLLTIFSPYYVIFLGEEKKRINDSTFNFIISKADSAFNNKKYGDATNLYRNALLLKDSPYADSQLEKLSNISRIEYEKKDREESKKLQEKNDSLFRETDLYKDQLKIRKEAEENSIPKYKRIINVFKK